jgi:hypothetical protein
MPAIRPWLQLPRSGGEGSRKLAGDRCAGPQQKILTPEIDHRGAIFPSRDNIAKPPELCRTASGVTQFWPHVGPSSSSVAASDAQASNVKAYVEGASRNANHQFATLADRLDRIERTRAEPNVKLARIAEAVDRLEKQRKSAMAAVAAPAAAAPEITGTVKLGTPQKKGTGTMAGPPEARLAFGNNRRRRRSFALAVRCSVGLCVSPSDAKESQRRCRQ